MGGAILDAQNVKLLRRPFENIRPVHGEENSDRQQTGCLGVLEIITQPTLGSLWLRLPLPKFLATAVGPLLPWERAATRRSWRQPTPQPQPISWSIHCARARLTHDIKHHMRHHMRYVDPTCGGSSEIVVYFQQRSDAQLCP